MHISARKNRHRQQRRRRLVALLFRLGVVAGTLGVTAFYSYRVGMEVGGADLAALRGETERLQGLLQQRQDEIARLQDAVVEAERTAGEYRSQTADATIGAEMQDLLRLVQAKLDSGLPKDRVALFITAADTPKNCGETVVKNVRPRTTGSKATEAAIARFADGLTVSASGAAGTNAAGQPVAWYDPQQPITVSFGHANGPDKVISGVLPLRHVVIIGNREHRFNLKAGARGVLEVSGDRCDLLAG